MAAPEKRVPIRPAFGPKAALLANISDLLLEELVYATDEGAHYVVRLSGPSKVLVAASALTLADKTKLDGIAANANNYTLPVATNSVLGGVKVDNTSVTADPDGTLHAVGVGGGGSVTLVSGVAPVQVTNGTTTPSISVQTATTTDVGVVRLADSAAIAAGTAGRVVDAAQLQAFGSVPSGRQITAGSGLTGGGDLSADRSLAADYASQAEAEAGSDNVKLMTPLRVAQAKADRVPTSRQVLPGLGLAGGGALTGDVTLQIDLASQAEAEAGASNTKAMTPLRVAQQIAARITDNLASTSVTQALSAAQGKVLQDNKVGITRQVIAGAGLTGGGNLSADRTLALDVASQLEAETGTDNVKAMTPLRVAQATSDLVPNARQVASGTGLTGGGDLTADRTLALTGQALAFHNLASNGLVVRSGPGAALVRTLTPAAGVTVADGGGVAGNPTIGLDVASQVQAEAGTENTRPMTPLRTAQAIAALAPQLTVVREVFTSSGTFTKNARDAFYLIECIGAGASGARSASATPAGGGGGGGMVQRFLAASEVAATEVVVVGAGGAAVTAVGGANGNNGGSSAFGSLLTAYGGMGGISTGDGGQGGGAFDPAAVSVGAVPQGGFLGAASGFPSVYGGGGGNSGASVFGGGGGGRSSGGGTAGGPSSMAGAGGAGGNSSSGQIGQEPGGGGGATQTGAQSGAGARGEVRVYRFQKSI